MSIESIAARVEAATEGPWEVGERAEDEYFGYYTGIRVAGQEKWEHAILVGEPTYNAENDVAFIAHAPEDIPALLAVARAALSLRAVALNPPVGRWGSGVVAAWDVLDAALADLERMP
jgi:hypothetical protein